MNIPIDLTNASTTYSSISRSTSQPDTNSNRMFENTIHNPQPLSSSHEKQSVQDTRPSIDRTVNELRVNLSSPSAYQQPVQNSLQIDENLPQQYITRFTFFKNQLLRRIFFLFFYQ